MISDDYQARVLDHIEARKALGRYLDLVIPIRRSGVESRDVLIHVLYARSVQHQTFLRGNGVTDDVPPG